MSLMEGYVFYTDRDKLPFTITKINENSFKVNRENIKSNIRIKKEHMEFVMNHPNANTNFCNKSMGCASYAILFIKN